MTRGERVVRLDLQPTTGAPRKARMALAELADVLAPEVLDDATLLTSEVVSRWLSEPGAGSLQMRAWLTHDGVRVAVEDDGRPDAWEARGSDDEAPTALGLIAAIADGWGLSHGTGTMLWFEVRAHTG